MAENWGAFLDAKLVMLMVPGGTGPLFIPGSGSEGTGQCWGMRGGQVPPAPPGSQEVNKGEEVSRGPERRSVARG